MALRQKGAKIDVRSALSVKKVKVLLKQFTAPHTNDEISHLTFFTPPSYIHNALLLLYYLFLIADALKDIYSFRRQKGEGDKSDN